jgi:mono/diheme cytochrome c family protein
MNRSFLFAAGLLLGSYCAFAQAPTPEQLQVGKAVYAKNCLSCHMVDGAGVPGLNPPLAKTDWVLGDKKRLINVVLLGLNDPIIVNGDEYANPMPAQPHLSDKEIADVLTYIRNSFGNKASVVTEAEVKVQRGKAGAAKPK